MSTTNPPGYGSVNQQTAMEEQTRGVSLRRLSSLVGKTKVRFALLVQPGQVSCCTEKAAADEVTDRKFWNTSRPGCKRVAFHVWTSMGLLKVRKKLPVFRSNMAKLLREGLMESGVTRETGVPGDEI